MNEVKSISGKNTTEPHKQTILWVKYILNLDSALLELPLLFVATNPMYH